MLYGMTVTIREEGENVKYSEEARLILEKIGRHGWVVNEVLEGDRYALYKRGHLIRAHWKYLISVPVSTKEEPTHA